MSHALELEDFLRYKQKIAHECKVEQVKNFCGALNNQETDLNYESCEVKTCYFPKALRQFKIVWKLLYWK